MNDGYTERERTIKKYKVSEAVASARRRLKKQGFTSICVDSVERNRSYDDLLTLVEYNELIQKIIDDTLYWC